MPSTSKQERIERATAEFLGACRRYDSSNLLKYHIGDQDIASHSLDPNSIYKLAVSATAVPDRQLKYGATITYDGWLFWFGSIEFPLLSDDFKDGVSKVQIENIAKLFIDLVYKRVAVALHIVDISNDKAYDHVGNKIDKAVAIAQFYIKDDQYRLLATSLPYAKWVPAVDDSTGTLCNNIDSIELIIIENDKDATEPFGTSITLLGALSFAFDVGLDQQTVKKLSDLKPIKQTLKLMEQ